MSAGDIVFMHRQSSYNKEAGVEGSNRWSKHYYMPAQSDRSAVRGKLHCSCSSCIPDTCWCCQRVPRKTGWVRDWLGNYRPGSESQHRVQGPVNGLQMHTSLLVWPLVPAGHLACCVSGMDEPLMTLSLVSP